MIPSFYHDKMIKTSLMLKVMADVSNGLKQRVKVAGFSMPLLNRYKDAAGIISEPQPDKSSLWRLK